MPRIGTEHEKLGYQLDTLEPMNFDHISRLLDGMASRFGYERVMEGEHIIGLQKVLNIAARFQHILFGLLTYMP